MLSPEALGRALAEAPDPELARTALSRVGDRAEAREALARPEVLPGAVRVLGLSGAAADFLVAHPEEAAALGDLRPRSRGDLAEEAARDGARLGREDGLRVFRRRAMLRLAARDLLGASLEDIVAGISAVAEVCLELAAQRTGLAVLGLGKLGGAELNYASDVDVIFIHPGWGQEAQRQGERAAAGVISSLSEPTAEGVALRVDASLRPGGRAGALSRSLAATVEYYERQAATWERQALIKLRPVAGDLQLGRRFMEAVVPFVYPEQLEPAAIDEVRRTKVRIEEYVRARGKESVEVKRGRGGIRDVEFAVQLLQIVHGRRDPSLREPNTLRALSALAGQGYVAAKDADELADAYVFLRRLEHRLQMVSDLQTHELPEDPVALGRVARSMDLPDGEALSAEYGRVTSLVRGLHERLFYRPLLEAFAGPAAASHGADRAATEELLAGLGFREPSSAYEVLGRVVDPADRAGRVFAHVFPVMAPALALAANPDAALLRLDRVAVRLRGNAELADTMASDPEAARRLAHVTAASSFATDLLVSRPELLKALQTDGSETSDPDARLLATVAGYAGRETRAEEVGGSLAAIADSIVAASIEAAAPQVPLAVVALGKLGARELNFASDLDLVFVYEGEGPDDFAEAARAAERVLEGVREAGWEPDADLRPEGRSGPLARSIAGFLEYWERWAQPWEFQALLRARAVAGDTGLGRRFESLAADLAFPEMVPPAWVLEIRKMRVRMEWERVKPPEAARFAFKLGYGSLADVQFAVELALMRHGAAHPEVRSRRTLDAIEALAAARLIEDSSAMALAEAFTFLSDVKNALEVDRRVHAEVLPPQPEAQVALARRLGYEEYPRQAFIEDYRRITRRARRAMERVFYGDDG